MQWADVSSPSNHVECVKAVLAHVMLGFVAELLCWELAWVNIVSWISKSSQVISQTLFLLDNIIVGYSIKVMDGQRKTNGRKVLVQSRIFILCRQFSANSCYTVLGIVPLGNLWSHSPWLTTVWIIKPIIKLPFVPKAVVVVEDKGDWEVTVLFCRLSWAFFIRFI